MPFGSRIGGVRGSGTDSTGLQLGDCGFAGVTTKCRGGDTGGRGGGLELSQFEIRSRETLAFPRAQLGDARIAGGLRVRLPVGKIIAAAADVSNVFSVNGTAVSARTRRRCISVDCRKGAERVW